MAKAHVFENKKLIPGFIFGGKGMRFRWLSLLIAVFFLWAIPGTVFAAKKVPDQPAEKTPSVKASQPSRKLADMATKKWTGDLDGMIKRRIIRALVPYSKTFYFNDRGTERGLAYEALRLFEEDLNKKLKTKNIRVHVVFLPVSRDKFIPYLREGKGTSP